MVFALEGNQLRESVSHPLEISVITRLELRDLTGDRRLEILVEGVVGAHGRAFEVFQYTPRKAEKIFESYNAAPIAVELEDLNGDGRIEVLNPTGNHYIFSYSEDICDFVVEVYEWDGKQFQDVTFRDLPADFQPTEAKRLNDGALRLVKANLWDEAHARLTQALQHSDDLRLRYNLESVKRHLDLFRSQIQRVTEAEDLDPQERALKLGVVEVLAGHYDRALDAWAKLDLANIDSERLSSLSGTVMKEKSESVLKLFPNRAGAHLARGIGLYIKGEYDQAAMEFRRAFELAPERKFIRTWVKWAES
jgi:tetratricopeptide (TPR) repeat protein